MDSTVAADVDVQVVENVLPYYRAVSAGYFTWSLLAETLGTLSGLLCPGHFLKNSEREAQISRNHSRPYLTTLRTNVTCISRHTYNLVVAVHGVLHTNWVAQGYTPRSILSNDQ